MLSFFFFSFTFFFSSYSFFGDGIEIELCEGGVGGDPDSFLTIGRIRDYYLFFKLSNCSLPFFFLLVSRYVMVMETRISV